MLKISDRIAYITRILKQYRFQNITLHSYKPGREKHSGWFRIIANKNGYRIFITELILHGQIMKYSYTLLYDRRVLLRYDNAPHHPEISTYPHHKHLGNLIKPLASPSIEEFMREAVSLMRNQQH